MIRQRLSLVMALVMVNAAVAVLACQCATADCVLPLQGSVKERSVQCHHEAAPAGEKTRPDQRCCGNCRLEKSAVLSEKLLDLAQGASPREGVEPAFLLSLSKDSSPAVVYNADLHGPPGTFFLKNILSTSVSFRAPPRGLIF